MTRRIEPLSAIHRKSLAVTLTVIAATLIASACGQSNAPAGMAFAPQEAMPCSV